MRIDLLSQRLVNPQIIPSIRFFNYQQYLDRLTPLLIFLGIMICLIAFILLFLTGGVQWIMAGGNKQSLENARNKIVNAVTGLLILLLLWLILQFANLIFGINIGGLGYPYVPSTPTPTPPACIPAGENGSCDTISCCSGCCLSHQYCLPGGCIPLNSSGCGDGGSGSCSCCPGSYCLAGYCTCGEHGSICSPSQPCCESLGLTCVSGTPNNTCEPTTQPTSTPRPPTNTPTPPINTPTPTPSHYGCVSGQCILVAGAGADQCWQTCAHDPPYCNVAITPNDFNMYVGETITYSREVTNLYLWMASNAFFAESLSTPPAISTNEINQTLVVTALAPGIARIKTDIFVYESGTPGIEILGCTTFRDIVVTAAP